MAGFGGIPSGLRLKVAQSVAQRQHKKACNTVVLLMLVGFYIGSRLCQAVITNCIYGFKHPLHCVTGMNDCFFNDQH